jgi:hypothetical protein
MGSLAVNAATYPISAALTSDITLPTGATESTIFTVGSVDALGQSVHVTGVLVIKTVSTPTANSSWMLHVKVGSTVAAAFSVDVLAPSVTNYITVPIDALVTPPTGSQSVVITCSCSSNLGGDTAYLMATKTPGTAITAVGLRR